MKIKRARHFIDPFKKYIGNTVPKFTPLYSFQTLALIITGALALMVLYDFYGTPA